MRAALIVVAATFMAVSSPVPVTRGGRIGRLQIDGSTRAAIVAIRGQPDAERVGGWNGSLRYRALGYGCLTRPTSVAWPLLRGGPYCRTVFFLDVRDRRLRDFYTASPRYMSDDGVRIGMPTATAERLLDRRVFVGCEATLSIGNLPLTIAFAGGHRRPDGRLLGGHVYAFVLHSHSHDLGIFDCL